MYYDSAESMNRHRNPSQSFHHHNEASTTKPRPPFSERGSGMMAVTRPLLLLLVVFPRAENTSPFLHVTNNSFMLNLVNSVTQGTQPNAVGKDPTYGACVLETSCDHVNWSISGLAHVTARRIIQENGWKRVLVIVEEGSDGWADCLGSHLVTMVFWCSDDWWRPLVSSERAVLHILVFCPFSHFLSSFSKIYRLPMTLLRPVLRWLVLDLTGELMSQEIKDFSDKMALIIPVRNKTLLSWQHSTPGSKPVLEVLENSAEGHMKVTALVDSCGSTSGRLPSLPAGFHGLGGRLIRATTHVEVPYTYLRQTHDNNSHYTGPTMEILALLANSLHFRYTVRGPVDNQFGSLDDRGHWNGMVGMLHRQEVDLIAASLSFNAQRAQVVDYTFEFSEEPVVALMALNQEHITFFLRPFSLSVWLLCGVYILVMGIILYFSSVAMGVKHWRSTTLIKFDKAGELSNWLWVSHGMFLLQGAMLPPLGSWSGRLLVAVGWIFVVVVTSTYTGNLVAALSTNTVSLPFHTVEELAGQDQYLPLVEKGTATALFLQHSTSGPLSRLYRHMAGRSDAWADSAADGVERLLRGGHALLGSRGNKYERAQNAGACHVVILPEALLSSGVGFALPKGSPFLPYFSDKIMRITEAGLVENWKSQFRSKNKCALQRQQQVSQRAVTLPDTRVVFYLLAGGLGLAAILLLLETVSQTFRMSVVVQYLFGRTRIKRT